MLLHTTLQQSVIVPPGLRCRRQRHGPSAGAAAAFGPWRGPSPTPALEGMPGDAVVQPRLKAGQRQSRGHGAVSSVASLRW